MGCVNASDAHKLKTMIIGKFAEKYIVDVQRNPALLPTYLKVG